MGAASAAGVRWTLIGRRCRSAARSRVELELLFGRLRLPFLLIATAVGVAALNGRRPLKRSAVPDDAAGGASRSVATPRPQGGS